MKFIRLSGAENAFDFGVRVFRRCSFGRGAGFDFSFYPLICFEEYRNFSFPWVPIGFVKIPNNKSITNPQSNQGPEGFHTKVEESVNRATHGFYSWCVGEGFDASAERVVWVVSFIDLEHEQSYDKYNEEHSQNYARNLRHGGHFYDLSDADLINNVARASMTRRSAPAIICEE